MNKYLSILFFSAFLFLRNSANAQTCPSYGPYIHGNNLGTDPGLVLMCDVMADKDGIVNNTYFSTIGFNIGPRGAYCGIQKKADSSGIFNNIFSIWDLTETDRNGTHECYAEYSIPGGLVSGFGGEGTGLHTDDNMGWTPGVWYTTVVRRWYRGDDKTRVGFFIYNHATQKWTHYVTGVTPEQNTFLLTNGDIAGFLENFSGGPIPRSAYWGNWWKLDSSDAWHKATAAGLDAGTGAWTSQQISPSVIKMGSCGNYTAAGLSTSYPLNISGSKPTVAVAGQITQAQAYYDATAQKIYTSWSIDDTKSPQLSYYINIYDNASMNGAPIYSDSASVPNFRQDTLAASGLVQGATYYASIQIKDIFDQLSAPYNFSFTNTPPACNSTLITLQPSNQTGCKGSYVTFEAATTGVGSTYQWQLSADGGASWYNEFDSTRPANTTRGGKTTALVISDLFNTFNGMQVRLKISNTGCADIFTNTATVTVNGPIIDTQPADQTVCQNVTTTFNVSATNAASYQWQVNNPYNPNGWVNVSANGNGSSYSSVSTADTNKQYRVIVDDGAGCTLASAAATLYKCCEPLPAGWALENIGNPAIPSTACYSSATQEFTITASSQATGLADPNDNVPFIYQTLTGDGQIVAKVRNVSTTYNFSGGIMVRNSLATNSAYAYLNSLDTRGVFDQYRTTDGANTGYQAVTTLAMPMWLKLQRKGNVVKSFYSSDNINWTAYHTYNFTALNTTVYVGLTASGNGAVTNIDSVSAGPIPIIACTGGSVNGCPAYDTVPGKAINFYDYTYFNVPVNIPSTKTFTFTGWIKPKGVLGSQSSILAWDNGYFYMGQGDDNQLGYVWNAGDASNTWNSGLVVPADKWSFVAMVVHPDSTTLYLNNKISTNATPQGLSDVANGILGNSNQGAGFFLGQMDELTVWKRALSINEIDSMRHLTKEKLAMPTSVNRDAALVAYFQFNDSLSTSSYNQIDSSMFAFGGGANKITSTVPVGAGNSAMQTVSGAGNYAFGNTGVTLSFPASATYPNGNIWVTRINQLPDAVPKVTAASPAYWVVNNYGDSAFSPLASMQINNVLNIVTADAATPNNFSFFKRELVAEGATWGVPVNNATNAVAGNLGSLTFAPANISSQGQIIAAKGFILPPVVDTIPGKAITLTGYPDKLIAPEVAVAATNTFTVTGWIKPTGTQNPFSAIFMNKPTASIFMVRNNNELGYQWNNDNSWSWSSGLTVPANQWSYVAMVITPTATTLYLNNQKAVHTGVTNAAIAQTGFYFGEDSRNYTNRSFIGQMDEFTVWNRALSDDEIRGMRHLTKEKQIDYTKSGYDASLVGYWQFNEAATTSASNIISGTSNNFVGNASKIASTVPIGKGIAVKNSVTTSGIYSFGNTGVKMGFPAGTVPNGDLWITRLNQNPNGVPTGNADVSQYWIVNNYGTNSTFTTLDSMVFNGVLNISSANAALPSSFQLYKRTDNAEGATWGTAQAVGTSAVAGNPGSISFGVGNNITSFSQFYLTNPATALPVQLISFNATKQTQDVLLKWLVTNESSFDYYEIEHSVDGTIFSSIGIVKGTGLSNYSFTDKQPVNGENYYRLKMVDDDGHFRYSTVVEIAIENNGFIRFSPNPVRSGESLLVQNISSSEAQISFYLADGKLFGTYTIAANGKIQLNNLPRGSMLYQAVNKSGKKASGVQVVL